MKFFIFIYLFLSTIIIFYIDYMSYKYLAELTALDNPYRDKSYKWYQDFKFYLITFLVLIIAVFGAVSNFLIWFI